MEMHVLALREQSLGFGNAQGKQLPFGGGDALGKEFAHLGPVMEVDGFTGTGGG
jgi:hypothetical protein